MSTMLRVLESIRSASITADAKDFKPVHVTLAACGSTAVTRLMVEMLVSREPAAHLCNKQQFIRLLDRLIDEFQPKLSLEANNSCLTHCDN